MGGGRKVQGNSAQNSESGADSTVSASIWERTEQILAGSEQTERTVVSPLPVARVSPLLHEITPANRPPSVFPRQRPTMDEEMYVPYPYVISKG